MELSSDQLSLFTLLRVNRFLLFVLGHCFLLFVLGHCFLLFVLGHCFFMLVFSCLQDSLTSGFALDEPESAAGASV